MKFFPYALCAVMLIGVCSCSRYPEKGNKMESRPQYIIDVRNQAEYAQGHLAGAILIPHTEIEQKIPIAAADKNSSIALYCRSGRRAGIARETMERLGYKNVVNLGGAEEASEKLNVPIVR